MIAMELNGSHVGRLARFKWGSKRLKRRITIVHHHPGGRVSVRPYRYYQSAWEYIPFDAEVEFL